MRNDGNLECAYYYRDDDFECCTRNDELHRLDCSGCKEYKSMDEYCEEIKKEWED